MKHRGFTLIELLVVIGIIAVLAAIIFPVFATARGKARQIACASNERQIGMAIFEYVQDADEKYPHAVDPSDKYSNPPIWVASPPFVTAAMVDDVINHAPLINPDPHVPNQPGVLTPYIKSAEVWRCPSDIGYDTLDNAPGSTMNAHPSSYEAYGSSYLTRTEIILRNQLYTNLSAYQGCTELGPSQVNVLMDGSGRWHGGFLESQKRYNVLMADGHVVNQNRDQYFRTWNQYSLIQSPGCGP